MSFENYDSEHCHTCKRKFWDNGDFVFAHVYTPKIILVCCKIGIKLGCNCCLLYSCFNESNVSSLNLLDMEYNVKTCKDPYIAMLSIETSKR